MSGIITTFASIGVMCISGFAVSTALKWFHSYEYNISSNKKGGVSNDNRINNISKRLKSRS